MINERYQELLQKIVEILAEKNNEIGNLHDEISRLKELIAKAEQEGE